MKYSDDEQVISHNYLMFLDTAKAREANENNNSSSGVAGGSSTATNIVAKLKPVDKLIIRTKFTILEILEVQKMSVFFIHFQKLRLNLKLKIKT